MGKLSNADLRKVLDSVAILHSAADLGSLCERTLGCAMSLIPNSTMTAFDGLDPEGKYDGSLWYSPPETVPQERVELLANLVHEHPYCRDFFATKDQQIYRISDRLSLSKFHRTTLFNEFYRLFEGESQIASVFELAPGALVTCSFHRPKVDFNDAEVEMLRLITPHLKAAFKNAQYVEQLDRQRAYLDEIVSKGLIVTDERGKIVFESNLAQKWLPEYFPKPYFQGLPLEIALYLKQASAAANGEVYCRPAERLSVSAGNRRLDVWVTFDNQHREIFILLEERKPHAIEDFMRPSVTRREAEILYWVSCGKTDPEIAFLLSISPRTVQKHLEHIFTKFGVETRTAAVMHALVNHQYK